MLDAGCIVADPVSGIQHPVSSPQHRMSDPPQNTRPIGGRCTRSRRIGRTCRAGGCTTSTRGRPIRHAAHARGPTLLFVHGNPTWSFHWRRLIEALAAAAIAASQSDHIGCGLSDKPPRFLTLRRPHRQPVRRSSNQLDLERVTLVAQDWGGAIGLGAMLRMPERLERIVLFNTGAFPPRYIPWRIRACRVAGRWPTGRARGEPVQPGRAANDARAPQAARTGGRGRLSRAVRLVGESPRRVRLCARYSEPAPELHPTWQNARPQIERELADARRSAESR